MKKYTIILIAFISIIANTTILAQTYKVDESEATINDFTQKSVENNFLATNTTPQINTVGFTNNSVYIQQIGDNNSATAKTKSTSSNINLTQKGSQNYIYLNVKADVIEETVYQEGNNNYFLDFSNFGLEYHSAEITQKGNNQNITWFGGNSISEKLKITMQGESKTVIVRNFN